MQEKAEPVVGLVSLVLDQAKQKVSDKQVGLQGHGQEHPGCCGYPLHRGPLLQE